MRRGRSEFRAVMRAVRAALVVVGVGCGAACDRSEAGHERAAKPLNVLATIGGAGTTPGLFVIPRAITGDGRFIYVVDKSGRIQQIEPETGRCLAWWPLPESALGKPTGMTVALAPPGVGTPGERVLYVADTHYHRVLVYRLPEAGTRSVEGGGLFAGPLEASTPELLTQWGEYGEGDGQFIYATSVAVLTDERGERVERFYVSEYGGNDRVSVFDGARRFLFAFGKPGLGPGAEFQRPQQVVIDKAHKRLVIADSRNHRLGLFTYDGELLRWIGSPETAGSEPGRWRYPWGMHLLEDGSMLVVEHGNNRVQRVNLQSGESLGVWGKAGRRVGELAEPWGVWVTGGRAYVVDTGNHRVVAVEGIGH
ncbi:MAG: hypothetical protein ACKVS8_02420 [Phycisphaerales bacterium]